MDCPFIRTPYNYDVMEASNESALDCTDVLSLTKQSFADECDINTIVRNFGITGQLPDNVRAPQYGDFTGIFDYQSALNAVIAADEAFMSMNADVRARFHNDPAAFVEFCSNADNYDELVKMGLAIEGKGPVKAVSVAPVDPVPVVGTPIS